MTIVIVGPGAMGCLLSGIFTKSGAKVWVLDRSPERAEEISAQGITVTGIAGEWKVKVPVITQASQIGTADLVVICVKSYDTKNAAASIKPLVGEDTQVLTLQNGIGNIEIIAEAIGAEKVIGGVTNLGATLLGNGKVKFAGKGETVLGRIDGKIPVQMRAIRELFAGAGLQVRISRDIKGLLWSKLIINAGINPLTAVTRLPNGKLIEFEGTRRILREAVMEAIRVAKRKRIKLIYDDPLAKVEAVCEATSGNTSSMLQDIIRRRRTEIDFINGVIVRQAQELGIPAPVNSLLFDLVKVIESSYS